ncbi:hypothetical protein CCACVL1_01276, partial [Corchorus capsularis]
FWGKGNGPAFRFSSRTAFVF